MRARMMEVVRHNPLMARIRGFLGRAAARQPANAVPAAAADPALSARLEQVVDHLQLLNSQMEELTAVVARQRPRQAFPSDGVALDTTDPQIWYLWDDGDYFPLHPFHDRAGLLKRMRRDLYRVLAQAVAR